MSKLPQKTPPIKILKSPPQNLLQSRNSNRGGITKFASSKTSPGSTPKKSHTHSSDKKPNGGGRVATEESNIPEDEPIRSKLINNTSIKVPLTQSRLKDSQISPFTNKHENPIKQITKNSEKEDIKLSIAQNNLFKNSSKTPDKPNTVQNISPPLKNENPPIEPIIIDQKKSIDLNSAALQVLKNSVLVENKSCENINVAIRVRPFTQQETVSKQTKEAWSKSAGGKLVDKRKGVIYGFGIFIFEGDFK